MQVCPGDASLCLLLLLLSCWSLLDGKFASTWDLVEGSLYLAFSLVAVYACNTQCCQGQGSCNGVCMQLC